jgi:adenine C2-methylase RlmN of 23S rRNA A2503 and tRNA A37
MTGRREHVPPRSDKPAHEASYFHAPGQPVNTSVSLDHRKSRTISGRSTLLGAILTCDMCDTPTADLGSSRKLTAKIFSTD